MNWPAGPGRADVPPVVVAAHGGCGATTLATHLDAREVEATSHRLLLGGPCLVVASATVDGTVRAALCLKALQRRDHGGLRLRLVLVHDGLGRVPVDARARTRLLSHFVDAVHELPHVGRWRYQHTARRTASRRYSAAVARIDDALTAAAQPTTAPAASRALRISPLAAAAS